MVDSQSTHTKPWTWTIALDGGTTNTRARLLHEYAIKLTARRPVGVRDVLLSDAIRSIPSADAVGPSGPADQPNRGRLVDAVRAVVSDVNPSLVLSTVNAQAGASAPIDSIVAAGMLSSEVGLVTIPHVQAPAGLADLARGVAVRHIPEIADLPIYFVPGVRTAASAGADGWFQSDVMRGEECETLGAYSTLQARGAIESDRWQVFLWPGSHTKLVEVDPMGRITRSHTTLAGEMLQALAEHTLLKASLPEKLPDELNHDAAAAGARAVETQGLGRAAFLVRIAAVSAVFNPVERASFWIGAVVADDAANLARHPILANDRPVWIGGRQPLRSLYAAELARRHSGMITSLDDTLAESASAVGALEIASYRFRLDHEI